MKPIRSFLQSLALLALGFLAVFTIVFLLVDAILGGVL